MQEKLLSSCRGRGGDRHGSKYAAEGLVQEGLLQFLQGGEFAFVEASEEVGVYAQVVGGLLAVISAGIAQRAGESEGQQKLSGLMQDSQLPRRWPCWEGLLDTTLPLGGRQGAWGGAAECLWRPVHSRGWLESHLRIVNSSDMQFQTQRRNHLQYCCQLRIARRG